MIGKYKVITLCGSTKFKDEFLKVQKELTLQGNIVISVGVFGHSGDNEVLSEGTKEMLDDIHKRKIDMADEIFVVNVNGYIGESTRSEIEYAKAHNKPIKYYTDNVDNESNTCADEDNRLFVCEHCLWAIESREGPQVTKKHYIHEDTCASCSWCGESEFDILYEML